MSCCGQSGARTSPHWNGARTAPAADESALFEYFGRTALVIVGPVTGMTYRFNHPGARTAVHARDRTSLNAVPVLREVTARSGLPVSNEPSRRVQQ